MPSRRNQQNARRIQRATGVPYSVARGAAHAGPGRRSFTVPTWNAAVFDPSENQALRAVARLHDDALPMQAVEAVCAQLDLPDYDGDVIARHVRLQEDFAHGVESGEVDSYEYGLVVSEVSVPFRFDAELTVSTREANILVRDHGAAVVDHDGQWATVICPEVSLMYVATVRSEFEHVETIETSYLPA